MKQLGPNSAEDAEGEGTDAWITSWLEDVQSPLSFAPNYSTNLTSDQRSGLDCDSFDLDARTTSGYCFIFDSDFKIEDVEDHKD